MRWRRLALLCAAGAFLLGPGCTQPKPKLRVAIWPGYFAEDTIPNFKREFGCDVEVVEITSGDMLRLRIERPPSGFDVVFVDDNLLPEMIASGRLEKLDLARIPNFKNIAPKFRGLPQDPKNQYSVPYMWGTTGIAYNKKEVNPPPDSWAVLWDPKVAARMTMLDDRREAFVAAMLVNGDDPRNPTAESIDRAKKKLLERKPLAYDSYPTERLEDGEAWLSHCFSPDAFQASQGKKKAEIGYVIPKEGATLWYDAMAVPERAPHPDLAHAFIDYLLRPGVSAAISNSRFSANPNELAQQHIRKEIRENPLIYPPEETLKRCFPLPALSLTLRRRMEEAWAEVGRK